MLQLRKASETDIEQIGLLFKETILHKNVRDYEPEQVKAWASGYNETDKWKKKIAEQYFLVAIEDDTLCGMASITPKGYIDYMFVGKDHQGKGVASMLFNALMLKAVEWKVKKLTADVSITAKPFFLHKGFLVVREQEVLLKGIYLTNFYMEKLC
jgi:putative acetyltransferase